MERGIVYGILGLHYLLGGVSYALMVSALADHRMWDAALAAAIAGLMMLSIIRLQDALKGRW